ncbi:MAG: endolytic transglycosylase MltG [Clostridia bacterium]|nr:endolytic transglycosylase MltG [Clostridia bacterium]
MEQNKNLPEEHISEQPEEMVNDPIMEKYLSRKKKKKKKFQHLKNILLIVLILAIILLVIEFSGIGRKRNTTVEIPEGVGTRYIAQLLKENDYIGNDVLFTVYSVLTGRTYKEGPHFIADTGYANIADALETDTFVETVNMTFYEGMELREIKANLVEKGLCTAEEFDTYADKAYYEFEFLKEIPDRENELEGYLFPDTYNFSFEEGAKSIINKMLANFDKKVYQPYKQDIKNQHLSLDNVIIMASVVEREAADKNELDLVSGVFYNRLNKKGEGYGKLESCATVQYILQERKDVLTIEDTEIDSPYNTYKYSGLPVGPIASPGLGAIEAAIFPANTDYLFFVADGNGTHYFAETFAEHQENTRKAGL